jgi:CRISPR/Cas system-associated protein Csm6
VALQQPIARIDATILQQLDSRLTETSEELAQKVEDQLATRVQRFEALSQAMMTMVGDPVDALSAKLDKVVRAQETAPNVLHSIGELTQIQGQLAAAITSLRQEGVEREALLRAALAKLDRLTGGNR